MAQFDINGALEEGYSKLDIARYLTAQGMLTPENHFQLLKASQGPQGMVTGTLAQPSRDIMDEPGNQPAYRTPEGTAVYTRPEATLPSRPPRGDFMEGLADAILEAGDMPAHANNLTQGLQGLWTAPTLEQKAGAGSRALRGAMGLATPFIPASAIAAPGAVLRGLALGSLAGTTANQLLPENTAPGYRDVLTDAASLIGGGIGTREGAGNVLATALADETGSMRLPRALTRPRRRITAQEVLDEAARGSGQFGGFSKYMEANPTAGENLLDLSDMTAPPGVSTGQLPRYDPTIPPRKGARERTVDAFNNPKVIEGLTRYIQDGAKALPENWYATNPLYKVFQKVWGSQAADKFKQMMGYNATTSSGMAVPNNIRSATLFNYLDEQGLPQPVGTLPGGYGAEMQKEHIRASNALRSTGTIDPLVNPKRSSFWHNFLGNWDMLTADRHFVRAIGMISEDPRFLKTSVYPEIKGADGKTIKLPAIKPQEMFSKGDLTMEEALNHPDYWEDAPSKNEYQHMENEFRKLANSLGYTTADAQGKLWIGAGKLTGLGSPPASWARVFAQRVQYTADRLGVDPQVVLEKVVRGKIPLLQVTGGAVGLGALANQEDGTSPRQ